MSLGEKDASEVLGSLQGKGDHYTKLSVAERKRLQDLEDAIAHISSETEKYRALAKKAAIEVMNLHVLTPNPAYQRADGVDVARQAQQVTTKVLTILEMKTNKLLQMQSEIIIKNKALKHEIDHFRRLRIQTDTSHAKFEADLVTVKRQIEERLAESASIVEERERLVAEKENLEIINKDEQRAFEAEFNEMGAFIKQQNEALEMSLLQERKEDQQRKLKNKPEDDGEAKAAAATTEEEVAIARQLGSLSQYTQNEMSLLSGIETKIHSYENMFDQLKRMSGTESLDEVVAAYMATEEEMFSLYNYMQALNTDIEAVHEQTTQLDLDVVIHKREQEEQEAMRRGILDDLQSRLQASAEHTQQLEEENKTLHEFVLQVGKKVQTFFFKIQCDQMDSKAKEAKDDGRKRGRASTVTRPEGRVTLLQQQGVSDSNVLEFMGCIEMRAVDVISEYLRKQRDGKVGAALSPTPGPSSPMVGGQDTHAPVDLDANLVFSEEDAGEEADEGRIVDLSAFKSKLRRKVARDLQIELR